MSNIILNKEDVTSILKLLKGIIEPHHASDAGANLLISIEETLIDLDCWVNNIFRFMLIQRRTTCWLEHSLDIIKSEQYENMNADIKSLKRSTRALKGLSIREIKGDDCLKEYLLFGFEVLDYHPEYLINKETDKQSNNHDNQ